MFTRFAVLLQRSGIKVKLLCQPGLVRLLQACTDLENIEAYREPNSCDKGWHWVPLLGLPWRIPWLRPPWPKHGDWLQHKGTALIKRREHWQKLLTLKPGQKLIGLHWQENPKKEDCPYRREQSIPLQAWDRLGCGENKYHKFIALQNLVGLKNWEQSSNLNFVAGQEKFMSSISLIDIAAIISMCEKVISTDSYVIHLAGNLGVQTLVALHHTPDWRWGLHKNHTLWYPTLKLFRQPAPNDWGSVVEEIAQELR